MGNQVLQNASFPLVYIKIKISRNCHLNFFSSDDTIKKIHWPHTVKTSHKNVSTQKCLHFFEANLEDFRILWRVEQLSCSISWQVMTRQNQSCKYRFAFLNTLHATWWHFTLWRACCGMRQAVIARFKIYFKSVNRNVHLLPNLIMQAVCD